MGDTHQGAPVARPSFPFPILVFVWLLIFFVATVVTFLYPESFASTATIRVERDHLDIPGFGEPAGPVAYDPYFIQTEFELLRSEEILSPVITKLNLNQRWASKYLGPQGGLLKTQETLRFLRANLVLNTIRNTSLIDITVYSVQPEEAAELANAIAESYRGCRLEQHSARLANGIEALEQDYQENKDQILKLQAEMLARSPTQTTQNTNLFDETQARFNELKRFDQVLLTKIAAEKADRSIPASFMVEIVNPAVPVLKPVRPNKPFNLALGLLIGGGVGLFLSTFIYVVQLLAYRRLSPDVTTPYPPRLRAIAHAVLALLVGLVFGYVIALPLDWFTIVFAPLVLLLCAGASAYIELANPSPQSPCAAATSQPKAGVLTP